MARPARGGTAAGGGDGSGGGWLRQCFNYIVACVQCLSHYFQLLRENVQTGRLVWFLRQLHHHYARRVVLILDRYSVHRAAAGFFAEHHPDWFTFEWLPSYSPKLNPVEQSWKHTKYDDLPNFIPDNLDHFHDNVYESQKYQHHDQTILRSFFAYAKLLL